MRLILSGAGVSKGQLVRQVVLSIVLGVVVAGDAFIIQALMNAVETSQWGLFGRLCVVCVLWVCLHVVMYWWRNVDADKLANSAIAGLRSQLLAKLEHSDLAKTVSRTDVLHSQLTTQLEAVKRDYLDTLLWGFYLICQLVVSVIAIFSLNPVLAAVAIVLCVPMAFIPVVAKRVVEKARVAVSAATDDVNDATGDLLAGLPDWRLRGSGQHFLSGVGKRITAWLRAANHEAFVRQGVDTVSHSMTDIILFGVWIGGGLLIMRGSMSVSQIVAFYSLIGNITVPLFQISGLVAQYQAGAAVLSRVEQTFDECVSEKRKSVPETVDTFVSGNNTETKSDARSENTGNVSGNELAVFGVHDDVHDSIVNNSSTSQMHVITYNHVCLHMPAQDANKTENATKNTGQSNVVSEINMELRTDRRYLVAGASGSGKSSLIRPLFRLDDDYSGTIAVDGVNIRVMGVTGIAAWAGLLSQSSHIFKASIRENIRMMDDRITDDMVLAACDQAMIGDWVRQRGLDSVIDNTLTAVSGGERQRLLLARVLVAGHTFCVFDELTTGLDNRTASLVQNAVFRTVPGFIYITHHIDDVVLANIDEILLVDDGVPVRYTDITAAQKVLAERGLLA